MKGATETKTVEFTTSAITTNAEGFGQNQEHSAGITIRSSLWVVLTLAFLTVSIFW